MLTDKNTNFSTDQVLTKIRSGKEGRDLVLTHLYNDTKLSSGIKSVIYKMGGSEENFKDVFASTLMQFVKTVLQKPDLVIKHELNTYITSIARYLWLANKRKDSKYSFQELPIEDSDENWEDGPETLVLKKEKFFLLQELMDELGTNCKEVLMYWANGYKMKEIAELMNYKSADMAKKKKYQCFKALLSYLEENPNIKSALR